MDVTKVVDLVARIPKHLSLHFSDFSTNLYRFYKFAIFGNKKKNKNKTDSRIYTPGKFWGLANRSLAGLVEQRRGGGRISGVLARRRRGRLGGKGRGDRVLPVGASDWVRGGLWRRRHGKGRRWWLYVAGDGAPTAMGGGG